MKQNKFNELPLSDRLMIIDGYGKYITSIQASHPGMVHLYSLNHSFVEIYTDCSNETMDIQMITYKDIDSWVDKIIPVLMWSCSKKH